MLCVCHELVSVDELLRVVLVEDRQELNVDLLQIELLQRGLEVAQWELLTATSLNVDWVRRETALEILLLGQLLLNVDL